MYVADRYYKLGTIFLGRDTRRAIVEYQKAIDYYPYEVRYRDEMNRAYIERARKAKSEEERHFWAKKAIEGAKELLRRTPGYANGYFTLGIANYLLAQDKYDKNIYEAIKYYKKAIKHNPFSADTYNNLGVIYNSQNRLDDAIRVFKEAYRMNPKHVASLDNLARIYITKNQLEKALEILEELQNTDPTYQSARIQNMIGYLYWKLGKIDKVEEQCKLALAEDPNDVSARENLGIIYFKKGMYKKAAIQFRKVLELEPDNIKARRMLQAIAEKGDE
jgi:tetratricopeptide (TPR) repeat protein